MRKILLILLALFVIPLVSAEVAIRSFDTTPAKVAPGEQIQLKLVLENVGDRDIDGILVNLDLSDVPFAPLGSSTEKLIDKIDEDDEETIFFEMVALPNAESQIYKIPVKISYNNTVKNSLISIEVSAKASLDVILEISDIVKVNDQGKITVKFINNGLTQIKFLKVTLKQNPAYEILSTNTVYIGEVDVDDFETEEFNIIPKIKNPQLSFEINYRDANNNEFTEVKYVNLNVYTEEEAKQLGLVKGNTFFTILIPIIIIIIIFIVYRRIRRKKNVS